MELIISLSYREDCDSIFQCLRMQTQFTGLQKSALLHLRNDNDWHDFGGTCLSKSYAMQVYWAVAQTYCIPVDTRM